LEQLKMYDEHSEVAALQRALGTEWPHINAARALARQTRSELHSALNRKDSEDTSIVVFGSLARDEYTAGSDIDWTLLVDGFADPKHLDLTREIKEIVSLHSAREPGREEVFGSMAFSHDLVHQIGGDDDTNKNTTRRILLLLESSAVGRPEAYDRVVRNVLERYLLEDRSFLRATASFRVPRFLLNDFARYWRTMAVDFAYKARTRARKGAAIRNMKLRMSRKLIYVSGLLNCFTCHLDLSAAQRSDLFNSIDADRRFVDYFRQRLTRTPLEVLAGAFLRREHLSAGAERVFLAYDTFLGALSDRATREHLEQLTPEKEESDEIYSQLRATSREFRDGILALFFDDRTELADLTKVYGLF
jgi:predicted nucleotidyltransferase